MTPEEAAELSRRVAEANRQSTGSQSGKNGFVALSWGGEVAIV
ncbi:hypothetical protein EES45_36330 [Streptomyces sp. ADI97-07]|nr:hypothetical protein [Streptomyces sp. ADI97-07]RPK69897.1 hypothetical protein EES45_36330 [Streptomyces sp. ADI97-07]